MLMRRSLRRSITPLVALVLSVGLCTVNYHAQSRKPYTKDAVVGMLKGEVAPPRVAVLARLRGIDFQLTSVVESELRRAGATDSLLETLRKLAPAPPPPLVPPAPPPAQIDVQTSPSAQVYVDDVFKGQASPRGHLVIENAKPGDHDLRVSLTGKRNYEQNVTVAAGRTTEISVALVDVGGTVVVQTSPGASVTLDGSSRGTTDASGQLSIPNVAAGSRELRVSAPGKNEYQKNILVPVGEQSRVNAVLTDAGGTVVVQTSPGAAITLDGSSRGTTNASGQLSIPNVAAGARELRISAPGKKEYQKNIHVTAGEQSSVNAVLADAGATVVIQTSPGAAIMLDGASRGTADLSGKLSLGEVTASSHDLRITAPGEKEYRENINVPAGQEIRIKASLADLEPTPGAVRINPKDGLKYVWIPPGKFVMGCSLGDEDCADIEKPSRRVTITRGFWMGQTPVTLGAYKRFAGAVGRQMRSAPDFNSAGASDNIPIVMVTWDDAHAYCQWMGGRLPTEAEWEYAARGGSSSAQYGNIGDIAWYSNNSQGHLHEVGQKRANKLGLYDMLGDVWEWVNDPYSKNYYWKSPSQDPPGPISGEYRVLRGGSWLQAPRNVRVSLRYGSLPSNGSNDIGFRCDGQAFAP